MAEWKLDVSRLVDRPAGHRALSMIVGLTGRRRPRRIAADPDRLPAAQRGSGTFLGLSAQVFVSGKAQMSGLRIEAIDGLPARVTNEDVRHETPPEPCVISLRLRGVSAVSGESGMDT
ncbi:hypothetical protein Acsp01_49510 [Actinoplanes sp. NBRC 101535]|nr:hypothetical protein Acsp01_49510 [Actinoplanes sp. NBRC 101535]